MGILQERVISGKPIMSEDISAHPVINAMCEGSVISPIFGRDTITVLVYVMPDLILA